MASSGPGKVVGTKLEETIRSHHDLFKGNCPWYNKAYKVSIRSSISLHIFAIVVVLIIAFCRSMFMQYYDGLATRCMQNGHVVDIVACSLDQIGLAEMKVGSITSSLCVDVLIGRLPAQVLIEKTGGTLILSDMFDTNVFVESFKKLFETADDGYLEMCFDVSILRKLFSIDTFVRKSFFLSARTPILF